MPNTLSKNRSGETVNLDQETAGDLGTYVIKIDVASATITYYGFANPGTATSVAKWQIRRKSVSGTVTTYAWADSNKNFDNIWDNRSSLTYA